MAGQQDAPIYVQGDALADVLIAVDAAIRRREAEKPPDAESVAV
jgi:hypothetical protein